MAWGDLTKAPFQRTEFLRSREELLVNGQHNGDLSDGYVGVEVDDIIKACKFFFDEVPTIGEQSNERIFEERFNRSPILLRRDLLNIVRRFLEDSDIKAALFSGNPTTEQLDSYALNESKSGSMAVVEGTYVDPQSVGRSGYLKSMAQNRVNAERIIPGIKIAFSIEKIENEKSRIDLLKKYLDLKTQIDGLRKKLGRINAFQRLLGASKQEEEQLNTLMTEITPIFRHLEKISRKKITPDFLVEEAVKL